VTLAGPTTRPAGPPLGTGRLESASIGTFQTESGVALPDVTLAYRHDGPNPSSPQVLVVHALTGSADAAADWWEPLIGPGRALDTSRYGVVCANLLGGRYGSTGPTSIDSRTGRPYATAFPALTARDEARALWALADRIGIERIALVTGGSLGGMVALEVALTRPGAVDVVAPIAAPASTGAMAVAWNHIQLQLLDALGERGLALARQLAMTTYRSEADFDERFGRRRERDGRASIASYLDYQGEKLVERFDPHTYRILVGVMDGHDIGRGRGGIATAFSLLARGGTRVVGVGIPGDILYGPGQVQALLESARRAGVETFYREIVSSKGHDAFLVEWPQLTEILADALSLVPADARPAEQDASAA